MGIKSIIDRMRLASRLDKGVVYPVFNRYLMSSSALSIGRFITSIQEEYLFYELSEYFLIYSKHFQSVELIRSLYRNLERFKDSSNYKEILKNIELAEEAIIDRKQSILNDLLEKNALDIITMLQKPKDADKEFIFEVYHNLDVLVEYFQSCSLIKASESNLVKFSPEIDLAQAQKSISKAKTLLGMDKFIPLSPERRLKSYTQKWVDEFMSKSAMDNFEGRVSLELASISLKDSLGAFYDFFCFGEYYHDRPFSEKYLYASSIFSRLVHLKEKNKGKEVVLQYKEVSVSCQVGMEEDVRYLYFWYWSYMLCLVTRDKVLLQELESHMPEAVKYKHYDEDRFHYGFWQSVARKTKDESVLLHIIDENGYSSWAWGGEYEEKFEDLHRCVQAVFDKDGMSFNKHLSIALEKFVRHYCLNYYDVEFDSLIENEYRSWVFLPLLATCCFAHDRGLKITVESEYIPKWIIEKDFQFDMKQMLS